MSHKSPLALLAAALLVAVAATAALRLLDAGDGSGAPTAVVRCTEEHEEGERESPHAKTPAEKAREKREERAKLASGDISYEEAVCEGAKETEDLSEPGDAMLARQLSGNSRRVPSDVFPRAVRQADAIGRATKKASPRAAATEWEFVGPANIGGRVLDIAVDPGDPNTVYTAAASGGVMKSTDGGVRFHPAWPANLTQAVGALVISPSGVLYAGTGETGPGGGSLTYGGTGVYRSTDRGATWERIGLAGSSRIGRIVLDPSDERRIFVAASGPLFRPGGERGLYLSEDGGAHWTRVLEGDNATTGAVDLAIDPKNPERMLAAMWDHQRQPDVRRYSGPGSGVYRSTDGGRTWARIGSPQMGPNSQIGRIGLAIDPENPDRAYATVSGLIGGYAGFYVTDDFGDTWTPRIDPILAAGPLTYGWWFGRVWVDPRNTDRIFVAGVDLLASQDSGNTWRAVSNGAHADQHAMVFDLRVRDRVWLGNDGGVYRSDDDARTWKKAKYEPYSQLYGMDVSERDPRRLTAGLQDNGAIRSWPREWNEFVGGDGQRTLINPANQDIVYGCSQYGACSVSRDGGDRSEDISNRYVSTRHNWFTPIELDPEDPSTVYIAGEIVSRSDDDARTFTPISPDLSNGPGREPNPLFKDYGTVTAIGPAPKETGTIYAGTDDGNLWFTHSGGGPRGWTKATDPDLPRAWVTRVTVSPADPDTAYVTYSGFRTGEDAAYLLRTTDGGRSWTDITGDLPRAPLNDVIVVDGKLVVAGDVGVFFSADEGRHWYRVGGNLPLAPAFDLRLHGPSSTLYAATFGRGIFRAPAAALAPPAVDVAPVTSRRGRMAVSVPRRRSCASKARLRIRVRSSGTVRVGTVLVYVNGRRAATRRGEARRRTVNVRLPRRRAAVRVVAIDDAGKRRTVRRTYRSCASRGRR